MNKEQLSLYHKNLCSFAKAIQVVGGDAAHVLRDEQHLLEILAHNGLEVSFVIHPNIGR